MRKKQTASCLRSVYILGLTESSIVPEHRQILSTVMSRNLLNNVAQRKDDFVAVGNESKKEKIYNESGIKK